MHLSGGVGIGGVLEPPGAQPVVIEDGAFVGSDTQLIAPVTVGKGAYIGTGTTIRENVPEGALAVSAGKQRNIEGWVAERKKKQG